MKRLKLAQSMHLLFLVCLLFTAIISVFIVKSKTGTAIFVMSDKAYDNIYTTSQDYEYYSNYISLYQSIPRIRGLNDRYFEKKLNKSIYKLSSQNRKNIISISRLYNENLLKDKLPPIKFEYTEKFSVIPSIKPYYNIAFFKYKYSGGAHGETSVNYLVINTQINSVVKLQDLFKSNINYLEILNKELSIQLQLLQDKNEIPLYKNPNEIKISAEQDFYIDVHGNIVIVFNVYEIAPYAAGTIEVIIPSYNISMYMK